MGRSRDTKDEVTMRGKDRDGVQGKGKRETKGTTGRMKGKGRRRERKEMNKESQLEMREKAFRKTEGNGRTASLDRGAQR